MVGVEQLGDPFPHRIPHRPSRFHEAVEGGGLKELPLPQGGRFQKSLAFGQGQIEDVLADGHPQMRDPDAGPFEGAVGQVLNGKMGIGGDVQKGAAPGVDDNHGNLSELG